MATYTYHALLSHLTPPSLPHNPISLPTSPPKPHVSSSTISALQLHPVTESALHILNHDLSSAHFLLRHMQGPPAWEAMYAHGILHRVEGDVDNARAWYSEVKDSDCFEVVWAEEQQQRQQQQLQLQPRQQQQQSQPQQQQHDQDQQEGQPQDQSSASSSSCPSNTAFSSAMSFLDQVESYKTSLKKKSKSSSSQPYPAIQRSTPTTTITPTATTMTPSHSRLPDRPNSNDAPQPPEIPSLSHLSDLSLREILRFLVYCETKFGIDPVADASSIWVSMADKHKDKAADMITGGEGWREF